MTAAILSGQGTYFALWRFVTEGPMWLPRKPPPNRLFTPQPTPEKSIRCRI
jgi:hypothetical protein